MSKIHTRGALSTNENPDSGPATESWSALGASFFFGKQGGLRCVIQRAVDWLGMKMGGCAAGAFFSCSNSVFLCSSQCFITDMNH